MAQKSRAEIAREYQWDAESVYASPAEWEKDLEKVPALLAALTAFRGKLTSPGAVAKAFAAEDDLNLLLGKLHLFAHMREDEDTSVGENQGRMSRLRGQLAKISGETAFLRPEILDQDEATLRGWLNAPELKDYRRSVEILLREKPHTLSTKEETLLGLASDVLGNPYEVFSKLCNADLKFDSVSDSAGKEHTVSNGAYGVLLQNPDRTLRQNAFGSIYKTYGDHLNSIAALLGGSTKAHALNATIRKFPSSLEASLFNDNIPAKVYHSLIEAVNGALPIFHDYVDLRAKALGIDDINMWDFHTSMVPAMEVEVPWKECRAAVEEALKPLGEEYCRGVVASFAERWYDVYENKGKRSGAYSTGSFGQKPFMLLNYHDTLDDAFTTAHELGHSMHTYMSQKYQPFRYSDYPIFLAEIASITNEALLFNHLMQTKQDPQFRAYLLNHLCDSFRTTLFRQAMFAEFELAIHTRIEQGEALTAEWLCDFYYNLNAKFYGPRVKADRRIATEWARIPHFYYNFYVYKYSTGFVAAQIFSQRILEGQKGRDMYLKFLQSGSSRDPLDTVKLAGVDMTDPAVLQQAFGTFKTAVKELGALLQPV